LALCVRSDGAWLCSSCGTRLVGVLGAAIAHVRASGPCVAGRDSSQLLLCAPRCVMQYKLPCWFIHLSGLNQYSYHTKFGCRSHSDLAVRWWWQIEHMLFAGGTTQLCWWLCAGFVTKGSRNHRIACKCVGATPIQVPSGSAHALHVTWVRVWFIVLDWHNTVPQHCRTPLLCMHSACTALQLQHDAVTCSNVAKH
jgi:hypothetical protein